MTLFVATFAQGGHTVPSVFDYRVLALLPNEKALVVRQGLFEIRTWQCPTLTWGNPTLPSAILRFTSEFGMDSGGSTALLSSSKLGCVGLSYVFCNRFANRVGYMSSYSEFEILKRSCRRLVLFINLSVSAFSIHTPSLGVIWSSLTGN